MVYILNTMGNKFTDEHRRRLSESHKGQKAWNKGMGISCRPLSSVWNDMVGRCENKNRPMYLRYGGRGISICKEWKDYFRFEEDMLPTYEKGLTLERIDNNGNYCKGNCKWATYTEQNYNRRNNRTVFFDGAWNNLTKLADLSGIKRSTVYQRFYVYKWSVKDCLTRKAGC